MKKITVMIAGLLLPFMAHADQAQWAPAQQAYNDNSTFSDHGYVNACWLRYEKNSVGLIIIGGGSGHGGLTCYSSNGEKTEKYVALQEFKFGPQLGVHQRAGWMVFTSAGLGEGTDSYEAGIVGVEAEIGVGLSVAANAGVGADNRGNVSLTVGAEFGVGIGAGVTLKFTRISEVAPPDTD